MKIEVSATLRIREPSQTLCDWIKKELVVVNPDVIRKARMGFSTYGMPEKIFLYATDGEDVILPYGCLRDVLRLCPDAQVIPKFVDQPSVDFECNIPLYDYQKRAVKEMANGYYGILQAPAGSGKTQMGLAIASALGKKTLWLTHTRDLLLQSRSRALTYSRIGLIGTISEGRVSIGKAITFATIQTMSRLDLTLYRDTWDCIIVDECHRVAGSPAKLTQFSKVLNNLNARHKYGLSATVHRSDGLIKSTFAMLGGVVYDVPKTEVADKIMKVGVCPIPTTLTLTRDCINSDGTINHAKTITAMTEDEERNKLIIKWITKNKDHSCLILSDRIFHLERLIAMLPPEMQEQSVFIHGGGGQTGFIEKVPNVHKCDKKMREQGMEQMRTGEKKYLFATYSLAKEGLDVPRLDRLFLATPQQDYAVVVQSLGRIARVFKGKRKPIAYDFVDEEIPYFMGFFKRRCRHYRKEQVEFIETTL